MTDFMIERVARAICLCHGDQPERRIQEYGRTSHAYPAWEDYRKDACTAIKAMREPTEEMTHLGKSNAEDAYNDLHGQILRGCGCPKCDKGSHEAFRAIWQAMIDKALEDD